MGVGDELNDEVGGKGCVFCVIMVYEGVLFRRLRCLMGWVMGSLKQIWVPKSIFSYLKQIIV